MNYFIFLPLFGTEFISNEHAQSTVVFELCPGFTYKVKYAELAHYELVISHTMQNSF